MNVLIKIKFVSKREQQNVKKKLRQINIKIVVKIQHQFDFFQFITIIIESFSLFHQFFHNNYIIFILTIFAILQSFCEFFKTIV